MEENYLEIFEEIYNETYDFILKYVIYKCSNISDVNDIIQDTYLSLYNKFQKDGNNSIDNINGYLMGIANNKIKKHYRFIYKIKEISLFNKVDGDKLIDNLIDDVFIDKIVFNKIDSEIIWNKLSRKKSIIFKIFNMYYNYGMTIKEISGDLGISESNVKNHLYRTLRDLQKEFKKGSV